MKTMGANMANSPIKNVFTEKSSRRVKAIHPWDILVNERMPFTHIILELLLVVNDVREPLFVVDHVEPVLRGSRRVEKHSKR